MVPPAIGGVSPDRRDSKGAQRHRQWFAHPWRAARVSGRLHVRNGFQASEQTVLLAIDPGREVQIVWIAGGTAIPWGDGPQAVDRDRIAVRAGELANERVSVLIEHVDLPIAENRECPSRRFVPARCHPR